METILKIEEVENIDRHIQTENATHSFDGYKIITSKQEIFLLIGNEQNCCELSGYLSSNDNFNEFIGASLLDTRITDEQLKTYPFPDDEDTGLNTIFLDLITDRGVLQFVAYNSHNGYYGHYVLVLSNKVCKETVI